MDKRKKASKNISVLLMVFVVAVVVLASCAKKQKPDTPYTKLIGKWKNVKFATDDNRNGVIEPSEITTVPSYLDDELFFKSDGSGVETIVTNKESSIPLAFDWRILNNDSVLVAYRANDTITYALQGISSSDLTLTTTTQQGLAWYYYIKL